MKFLVPSAKGLFTAYSYTIQARLMSTQPLAPSNKIAKSFKTSLVKTPQYELEAISYRKKIYINPNDTEALYGLARSIEQGASITPADIRSTRLIRYSPHESSLDIQAELYRKVLRFKSKHFGAIRRLAQCIRKGASPKVEDLYDTWLEGGNFMLSDGEWGLTKPVIALLANALEERSKTLEKALAQAADAKTPQKTRPK